MPVDIEPNNSLINIANEIKNADKHFILIYAFNGIGKTRLSMEYKNQTKKIVTDDEYVKTGIYYNAYTEDLFHWDNDIEGKQGNYKLIVKPSKLDALHNQITEIDVASKLKLFFPKYNFKFEYVRQQESQDEKLKDIINQEHQGIKGITFTLKIDPPNDIPIKISRGEEQIFIFCFFLALAEIEEWTGSQDEYIWIDDPISSLDDNNIFAIVSSLIKLLDKIKDHNSQDSNKKRKIIITTHHAYFFILLKKRIEKYRKNISYILKLNNDHHELKIHDQEVFLYHLFTMQLLDDAIIKNELKKYHFAVLRQILESIASFLGKERFSDVLDLISFNENPLYSIAINNLSHADVYQAQINELTNEERRVIEEVFNAIQQKYNFKFKSTSQESM